MSGKPNPAYFAVSHSKVYCLTGIAAQVAASQKLYQFGTERCTNSTHPTARSDRSPQTFFGILQQVKIPS
jgi:hypothetical protein